MMRLIPALALWIFSTGMCCAQTMGPLTTLQAIAAVSNDQALRGPAVEFDATVLYYRSYEKTLFVQDGAATVYINANTSLALLPGDRIHVRGILASSFRPIVVNDTIDLLHHGNLPTPLKPHFNEMMKPDFDTRLVKLQARVRSADVILSSHRKSGDLQLLCEGNNLEAVIDSDDAAALHNLLDADVEIVGVMAGKFDGKFQRTGLLLHVTGLAQIKVLRPAPADAFALPLTPMDQMYAGFHVQDQRERVRVQGVITYYQPGAVVVLQNGKQSLWVSTHSRDPLRIGDIADASGFPDVRSGFLALTRSEVRDSGKWAPITPIPADWNLLATSTHIFDLVSYQGVIIAEVRTGNQDEYVLAADGKLITAVFRHPSETSELPTPPMRLIPLGSRIRVTGVCVPENSNPFDYDKGLNIFLRNYDDLAVLANPPWLNMHTLGMIAGLLLAIAIIAGMRSWFLERKVRYQTVALARRIEAEAAIEHRRSSILEDINGTRPLHEILLAILKMVSSKLDGASCWCRIGDEAPFGDFPPENSRFRVVSEPVAGRCGTPLGTLYAGLDPLLPPAGEESEMLIAGAGLAALAIETRRVYSDLRHRSEFDLLTDVHNRFSFERHLDALVETARSNQESFGLIYVDLDHFKDVNDLHGHHVGDLYLQEVTQRMRRQLRSHDLLARLGGDEFGILLPEAASHQAVEEISHRLTQCFQAPFEFDGIVLQGTASIGIALYPSDGDTKDKLLSTADAAMYAAKKAQRKESQG